MALKSCFALCLLPSGLVTSVSCCLTFKTEYQHQLQIGGAKSGAVELELHKMAISAWGPPVKGTPDHHQAAATLLPSPQELETSLPSIATFEPLESGGRRFSTLSSQRQSTKWEIQTVSAGSCDDR